MMWRPRAQRHYSTRSNPRTISRGLSETQNTVDPEHIKYLVKLSITSVENYLDRNVGAILNPRYSRFAEIDVEARQSFPCRLKEVKGQLAPATRVVEVVEGGGILLRRYDDTHYNNIRIGKSPWS
jgi:hypothetical protein